MNYSRTLRDGSARDDALKRRNSAVREAKPKLDTEKPADQKAEKKPAE